MYIVVSGDWMVNFFDNYIRSFIHGYQNFHIRYECLRFLEDNVYLNYFLIHTT